jgi:DNA-binding IclR family transcriptional regulator
MSNGQHGISTAPPGRRAANDTGGGVQSVDRALTVLEILARDGSARVSDVAAEVGVHKSTAFRLLSSLEGHELVEQDHERGKYQLSFGVLRLASAIPTRLDLGRQAQVVVDRLAERLGETINVAVVREYDAVNVQQAFGSAAVATQNWVGRLTPLHATASGKVLLAYMSSEQRNAILDHDLEAFTEHTITSRAALLDELDSIRELGFATAHDEFELGLNAAAVPVRDHTGDVVAAMSASGPAYRLDKESIGARTEELKAAGDEISRRLGYLERDPVAQ